MLSDDTNRSPDHNADYRSADRVIDISQPLSEETAPWPGDQPFRSSWTARIAEGSTVNLGAIQASTHLGTHADAPLHFSEEGGGVETLPLGAFVGPAQVVAVGGRATRGGAAQDAIRPEDVAHLDVPAAPRVLFKTRASGVAATAWSERFPPLLPETIEHLADEGARLVGTDAPSIDRVDSHALPAHHALARRGLVNLENLALAHVEPGRYWLSALPVRLVGMDAAPVRAVLLRGPRAA